MLRRILLGIAIGVGLVACQPSAGARPLSVRFGALPILDVLPVYVAQTEGYFAQAGLEVEVIPAASAAERDQLMQAGRIDAMVNDTVSTLFYNKEKAQIYVVRIARQAYPEAPQYFILANPNAGIQSPQDLKGVEIAISQGTVIEYMTDRILERAGLKPGDYQTVHIPRIPDRLQALMEGRVKAATLPDPFATLAIQQGAKVVADDREVRSISLSVLSFRAEVVERNPEAVRRFLQAWDRAVAAIRANPEKYAGLLAEKQLVPQPLVGTYRLPPYPDRALPTREQFADVIAWARAKGLLQADIPYERLVREVR
ncbi:MAG: ABC transporter substrate-binding protein [Thermoflexus hugenholtzii]|jgi:NitT/TauT family transport system substrate-binding protein|uniref:ABC transporter substrate-binding protein n=1 Tax=Thermoflexus TaxID=1495649 RepID=UPI001C78FC6D|nr:MULTISPECIES: MetQ/NlpA family ABC transporter substrate-binding protein [Thermoflexus]QWK12075.1 MAG: ABC transporter substrate-binding protein [Thermoflexus hugenholtzii]